jgi:FAD/FMN-containing dehydrogenase
VPHGLHYYWKSDYLDELSDEAIEILVTHACRASSPRSYTIMFQLGGAIRRIGDDDTAFEDRRAHHTLNINAVWSDALESDQHIRWTRDFWEAIHPVSHGGVYVNFLGNEGEERVRAAYGAAKYARLVALKNRYDPTNLFCLNQNIKPTV